VGAVIGALYALLLNRLGMPSFVATLAGLLAILGMQLYVLGTSGSINLPYGAPMVNFGQLMIIRLRSHIAGAGAGRRHPDDRLCGLGCVARQPTSRRHRWGAFSRAPSSSPCCSKWSSRT